MSHSVPAKRVPNGDDNGSSIKDEEETSGKLRVLRQRLSVGPLDPKEVHEGFIVLSEVGETALEQAIRNGTKLDSIHEHEHEGKAVLDLVRDQVSVIASKVEITTRFMDKMDSDMCEGFRLFKTEIKELRHEVIELKTLVVSLTKHFGIGSETTKV